ncbi:stage V sporulation protein AA [Paenibacillus alkalitolerans]|uniref:stage V sporulation protein AA n=1 Tax=Paenibacillus alkalitolerans TaxID=2799335 RepID=UPI0018F5004B|nr:stage V sporulation protein AA [Paenibacillus alkalitolerans]
MPSTVIYLRLRKRVRLPRGRPIVLEDVAHYIADPGLEEAIRGLQLHRPARGDGNLILIDMLNVVSKIRERLPDADIEHFGDPHSLVEIVTERKQANVIFFVVVWLLLFFGSGLAIMNFHEDVSMPAVHQRIVYLITGQRVEHPYILQIPYSVGIGLGMVVFFNHLFKKKINEEPSPLDVEMFKYEESVMQYVVSEEYRKLAENGKRTEAGEKR